MVRYSILAHFPKRKSTKGVPKRWKINLHQICFKNPGLFGIIKEVLLSSFGMKRGPAWGVVACYVEIQCQNLNWISVQSTGVVLLAPNFMNHLVISFKHDFYQKVTFQDICSVDPLWETFTTCKASSFFHLHHHTRTRQYSWDSPPACSPQC